MFNDEAVALLEKVKTRLQDIAFCSTNKDRYYGVMASIEQVEKLIEEYKILPRDLKKEN